jgi:hypothetical protein
VPPPEKGFVAFYGEVDDEMGGLPYQLSTQTRLLGK